MSELQKAYEYPDVFRAIMHSVPDSHKGSRINNVLRLLSDPHDSDFFIP